MTDQVLIQNGLLLSPAHEGEKEIDQKLDLRIANGVIVEIGNNLQPDSQECVINGEGLWISPGFIDLHTHLRDFAQAEREDIFSGTRAAACGGYTTVMAMANTDPPLDNTLMLSRMKQLIAERACIEVLPVACVTKNMAGAELTNMVELWELGAAAFSDDGMPISNLAVMRRALEYAQIVDAMIISHAEDKDLSGGGCMNESTTATRLGLAAIPAASESACVAREIEVLRQCGGRLHFAHVSTAASVALIAKAKSEDLKVTADATPHHIVLTDEDVKDYDSSYKMNPPLRSQHDQEALIKALSDGTIDIIATDHAPHTRSDKAKTFDQAPFGITGLETAFALVFSRLVTERKFSKLKLVELLSTRPAAILGREKRGITKGAPANLAVLDPQLKWTYDATQGFSKSQNSPFHGQQLTGKNIATMYGGRLVYQDQPQIHNRFVQNRLVTSGP